MPDEEQCGLRNDEWEFILGRIKETKCTPFIGPGLSETCYTPKEKIAETWASKEGYPFDDRTNLPRVAQFLGVKTDEMTPKERLVKELKLCTPPDFQDQYDPHRILAHLNFPVYITTSYDDFMFQALEKNKQKNPRRICYDSRPEPKKRRFTEPSIANPLVFHLYGYAGEPESLVLSENDYMKFLLSVAKRPELIPNPVQEAIVGSTLLFLGYQLDDWDFRILLIFLDRFFEEGLRQSPRRHISVQLAPFDQNTTPERRQKVQEHFNHYLGRNFNVDVHWATCEEFVRGLWDRHTE